VQHPRAAMILAPRHPERFPAVVALLEQMSVRYCRRSAWNGESLRAESSAGYNRRVAALYALADVAFVGGSLVPRGGTTL